MKTFNLAVMALVLGGGLLTSGVGRAGEVHRGGMSTGGSRLGGNAQVQTPAQGRGNGPVSGVGGRVMGTANSHRAPVGPQAQVNSATNKRPYHAAKKSYAVSTGIYW